jgi:hypothetical protein
VDAAGVKLNPRIVRWHAADRWSTIKAIFSAVQLSRTPLHEQVR